MTENNYFVKGLPIYDVYLFDKNKAHINWPNKDDLTQLGITRQSHL